MSLSPIVYKSTDPGAPALSGSVGALTTLLDAVLVDGYGTGMDAKAPAGWTREYTATNKRVYRNNPITATGYYLRVDDSSVLSGSNARYALLRAYESMTDVDTGTNLVPTLAQQANDVKWVKSLLLSSAARPWVVVATEKWFYLFVDVAAAGLDIATPQFAGDIESLVPGDLHGFLLPWNDIASYTGQNFINHSTLFNFSGRQYNNAPSLSFAATSPSIGYLARNLAGAVGPVVCQQISSKVGTNVTVGGGVAIAYPDPASNGLLLEKIEVAEGAYQLRGFLPNVFWPLHDHPFADLETIDGLVALPGVTLLAKSFRSAAPNSIARNGQVLIDITAAS